MWQWCGSKKVCMWQEVWQQEGLNVAVVRQQEGLNVAVVWQQEGLYVAVSVAARGFQCGSGVAARGCICGCGVAATQVSGHVFHRNVPIIMSGSLPKLIHVKFID